MAILGWLDSNQRTAESKAAADAPPVRGGMHRIRLAIRCPSGDVP
jgi:hypothetical protein